MRGAFALPLALAVALFQHAVAFSSSSPSTSSSSSSSPPNSTLPVVDLGYALHRASVNASGTASYYKFRDIRYAQPPVNKLRFAPPLSPTGRNPTVQDGGQNYICPQAGPDWGTTDAGARFLQVQAKSQASGPQMTEDCLFLDVLVPESIFSSETSTAAVAVWIHGGGYTGGFKSAYGNPATLIATSLEQGGEGLIWVAINYRLGLFGWIAGSDDVTPNAGLLDQRLALEWVQEHIHLFGGDPSRVTLVGESAGGGSVLHQITAYGGQGSVPFQQAIAQSPAFQPTLPIQQQAIFSQIVGNASQVSGKVVSTGDDLRNMKFGHLADVNNIMVGNSPYGQYTFSPVVDPSSNSFVPDLGGKLLLEGKFHNVSVLVGHNSNEGISFTDPSIEDEGEFATEVAQDFPTANSTLLSYITDELYPPVFDGTYGYHDQIGRTAAYVEDTVIDCNAHFLANTLKPARAYEFAIPPGVHAEDVYYTLFNGDTTTPDYGNPVDPALAHAFQQLLTKFIITGIPDIPGLPFQLYSENATKTIFNGTNFGQQVKESVREEQCRFWQKAPYYDPGARSIGGSSSSGGAQSRINHQKQASAAVGRHRPFLGLFSQRRFISFW